MSNSDFEIQDNPKIDLEKIDDSLLSFFKLCMFKNIPPDKKLIKKLLIEYFNILTNHKSISFKIKCIFYNKFFLTNLLKIFNYDIEKIKNNWLIINCNISDFFNEKINYKENKNYFSNLEAGKLEQYLNFFKDDKVNKNFIKNEYNKFRINLLFIFLKINKNSLFFWILIFLFFIISIYIAEKDNAFTVEQQIKNWIHFIFGKT